MKALFETLLARWLALDPETSTRLQRLDGKVVGIELKGTRLFCQMVFHAGRVALRWEDFLPEDLRISGTPLRLLSLKFSRDRQRFFADDVTITGNLTLGKEVLAIFDDWQPDLEEWASRWVGDMPAHQAGRWFRQTCQAVREVGRNLTDSLSEYLQEEVALCPSRTAVQDFLAEVDALRLQVDRLEARVVRLRGTV